jgi:hypothetical protein
VIHLDVVNVSNVCRNYFYLDIAYVCNDFQEFSCAFASVLDACCKCFSRFVRILQVFHLDVLKLDRDVAHVAKWLIYHNRLLHQLGRSACAWGSGGMERCSVAGAGSGGVLADRGMGA